VRGIRPQGRERVADRHAQSVISAREARPLPSLPLVQEVVDGGDGSESSSSAGRRSAAIQRIAATVSATIAFIRSPVEAMAVFRHEAAPIGSGEAAALDFFRGSLDRR
jgi:hypothetical protein